MDTKFIPMNTENIITKNKKKGTVGMKSFVSM